MISSKKIHGPDRRLATEYFLRKLKARTEKEGDCWVWQGAYRQVTPYMNFAGRQRNVRMMTLWALKGEPNLLAYVSCNNPECVNPDHVVKVTESQKNKRAAKNRNEQVRRAKVAVTMRAKYRKLTDEQVQEIRVSSEPAYMLAERFGVHRSLASRIRANKKWVQHGHWAGL